MDLKSILPSRLYEIIDRVELTSKQIILLSIWDLKKLTNLNKDDILILKHIVSQNCSQTPVNGNDIPEEAPRIPTGCKCIDRLLNGGFRRGTLTEIFGESGTGKTQIAIQAAALSYATGSVFICTEDLFPVTRYNQICEHYLKNKTYGENVFIELLTHPQELISCVKVRLPKLLDNNKISLLVIDSIAAPFRCEYTNYIQRAEELKDIGFSLINLAQKYNFAVICINQVTSTFDESDNVVPSLGLVWSNMISYRIKISKTNEMIKYNSRETNVRSFTLVTSPETPSDTAKFIITENGINEIL